MCSSIFSVSSYSQLDTTPALMRWLMKHYKIPTEFLSVLMSFAEVPTINEGSASAVFYEAPDNDHFSMCSMPASSPCLITE